MISANLLGGCQGTTGPAAIDPATGRAYGLSFPLLDMADFVTVHRQLLAHLGIERLLAHGPQAIHAAMAFGGGRHFDDMAALTDAVRTHLAATRGASRYLVMDTPFGHAASGPAHTLWGGEFARLLGPAA